MAAAAPMKRTMKSYAKVVVELSKAAAVLLVLLTAEVVSSSMTEGTQSCKDFTQTSHILVLQTNHNQEAGGLI